MSLKGVTPYYAFRYDGLNISAMRLSDILTYWYQLPIIWGIDLEMPPPAGDMLELRWVRDDWAKKTLNDEFKDKLFSRFQHNPDKYIGGVVTEPITLSQIGWRHEATGEEIVTIPSGWFEFGRGECSDLKYLSWHTFPVVPCIIPSLFMVFCGLSLTMLAGSASRQRQK